MLLTISKHLVIILEMKKIILLFNFLLRLLLVILKIHDGFLGQFQVTLELSLSSLKVHTQLLLLLQRTLKLHVDVNK